MHRSPSLGAKFVVLALVLACPGAAWCGKAPHRHDGFLLRLSGGPGHASTEVDENNGTNTDLSGLSGDLNIAIGGMVGKNLALHGTIFAWRVGDPDLDVNGASAGSLNGDVTMSAAGVGVTYWFMPTNLYLSGTLGFGELEFDLQGFSSADIDLGLAFDATVGKEWWVSANWGLGLAGGIGLHSIPEDGVNDNWSGVSVGLRFSATFN